MPVISVLCGLAVDAVYLSLGISAVAAVGQAAEILPGWMMTSATLFLLTLSIRPLYSIIRGWFGKDEGCSCSSGTCSSGHNHNDDHLHTHQEKTERLRRLMPKRPPGTDPALAGDQQGHESMNAPISRIPPMTAGEQ